MKIASLLRHPLCAAATLAALATVPAATHAQAQPQTAPAAASDALRIRALAATCANCHGTDGRAIEGSVVPGLAGVSARQLAAQMRGFKDGSRPATVMHQLAKGYTDAQIDALAAYFAAVPARAR